MNVQQNINHFWRFQSHKKRLASSNQYQIHKKDSAYLNILWPHFAHIGRKITFYYEILRKDISPAFFTLLSCNNLDNTIIQQSKFTLISKNRTKATDILRRDDFRHNTCNFLSLYFYDIVSKMALIPTGFGLKQPIINLKKKWVFFRFIYKKNSQTIERDWAAGIS